MSSVALYRGSEGGLDWEYLSWELPARLRPFVRESTGYTESTPGLLQRREFAGASVVLIFEFGPPLRVFSKGDAAASFDLIRSATARRFARGFVAGLDERFTFTEHDGFQSGMQINFTPPGARLFFGLPMSELSGRVVPFEDLAPDLSDLAERLYDLGDWTARFDLLETILVRRLFLKSSASVLRERNAGFAATGWAFTEMERCGGRLNVAELAGELAYSRKHLIHLFRQHVGVAPRLLGRILRFQNLIGYLRGTADEFGRLIPAAKPDWAAVAVHFGFYDQSHLIREMKAFTGRTPGHVHEILHPVHVESETQ